MTPGMRPDPDQPSEAASVYLRLKTLFGGAPARGSRRREKTIEPGASKPFGSGREPRGLGQVMDALTTELGWDASLEQTSLVASWEQLVGTETAAKSTPIGVEDGVLTVACASTAWATQLRLMRNELLARMAQEYPNAGIESIRFNGPDVPSWKYGPRSIPGRGPRDTYG